MRMLVKLGTRQYLAAGEEGSDELWNDVMRDWFRNQFRKLGNQALIYNQRQKEMEDGSELAFTWLEVDLQNGTLPSLDIWLAAVGWAVLACAIGFGYFMSRERDFAVRL